MGSEMCIRDRYCSNPDEDPTKETNVASGQNLKEGEGKRKRKGKDFRNAKNLTAGEEVFPKKGFMAVINGDKDVEGFMTRMGDEIGDHGP